MHARPASSLLRSGRWGQGAGRQMQPRGGDKTPPLLRGARHLSSPGAAELCDRGPRLGGARHTRGAAPAGGTAHSPPSGGAGAPGARSAQWPTCEMTQPGAARRPPRASPRWTFRHHSESERHGPRADPTVAPALLTVPWDRGGLRTQPLKVKRFTVSVPEDTDGPSQRRLRRPLPGRLRLLLSLGKGGLSVPVKLPTGRTACGGHTRVLTHTCACTFTCTRSHGHTCTHMRTCTHSHVCTDMHMCVPARMLTGVLAHVHTHVRRLVGAACRAFSTLALSLTTAASHDLSHTAGLKV